VSRETWVFLLRLKASTLTRSFIFHLTRIRSIYLEI
jgi:hypothetical protein